MDGWRGRLLNVIEWAEHRFDRWKLHLKLRRGWLGPVHVVPYRGHGTARRIQLTGRVLEERPLRLPSRDDSAWRNLRSMVKRFLSAEVPGARVGVRFGGREQISIADDEGFFEVCIEPEDPPEGGVWHGVGLEVRWPLAKGQGEASTIGEALVPPETAAFGVISDVDDTVVLTGATSLRMTLRLVLFSNAHTRLPFEGVAAFYRALAAGAGGEESNPIFYVSTGPWNLYDLLSDFLKIQDIPAGPIFLKDWAGLKDVLRGMNHRRHKLEVIRGIMRSHPSLPFVLVGDSGQEDAETYGQIAREHPDRVLAVYIRDVDHRTGERDRIVHGIADELRSRKVPMLLVKDTVSAAEHAAATGLIDPATLPEIREEKEEDAADDDTFF